MSSERQEDKPKTTVCVQAAAVETGTTCWRHYAKQLLLLLRRRTIGKKKLGLSGNFPLHLKQ